MFWNKQKRDLMDTPFWSIDHMHDSGIWPSLVNSDRSVVKKMNEVVKLGWYIRINLLRYRFTKLLSCLPECISSQCACLNSNGRIFKPMGKSYFCIAGDDSCLLTLFWPWEIFNWHFLTRNDFTTGFWEGAGLKERGTRLWREVRFCMQIEYFNVDFYINSS